MAIVYSTTPRHRGHIWISCSGAVPLLLGSLIMLTMMTFNARANADETERVANTENSMDMNANDGANSVTLTRTALIDQADSPEKLEDALIASTVSELIRSAVVGALLFNSSDHPIAAELSAQLPLGINAELPFRLVERQQGLESIRVTVAVAREDLDPLIAQHDPQRMQERLRQALLDNYSSLPSTTWQAVGLLDLALIKAQRDLFASLGVINLPNTLGNPLEYRQAFLQSLKSDTSLLQLLREWPGHPDAVNYLLHQRQASFSDQTQDQKPSQATSQKHQQLAKLALLSLTCARPQAGFNAYLGNMGITAIAPSPDQNTVLQMTFMCGGFVTPATPAQPPHPLLLDVVYDAFERGVYLNRTVALLELMLLEAPGHSVLWEYLSAAYMAQDRLDAALIGARAWLALDVGNPEAFTHYLTVLNAHGQLPSVLQTLFHNSL